MNNWTSRLLYAAKFFLCGIIHIVFIYLLYRIRVLGRLQGLHAGEVSGSDFGVFLMPTLLAFTGYFYLTSAKSPMINNKVLWMLVRIGVSVACTIISLEAALVLAFNAFGT